MGKFIKMAWRNMWRNWRRTAIALVAIVLGLILLLLMDGLIKGSDQAIFGNAVRLYGGNIQIHAPGFREKAHRLPLLPLDNPDAVVQAARAQPQVKAIARRISTAGFASSREGAFPVVIVGVEPEAEKPVSIQAEHVAGGRYLLAEDGDAVFIGKGLADALGVTVGDRINLLGHSKQGAMRQHTMTVVGIYDLGMPEIEKGTVFTNLLDAQTLYGLRNQVTEVTLTLESVGQEEEVVNALKAALPGYEVDSWETLRPEIRQTLDTKLAFTSVIGLVVVMIASIGILNLQLMAVFERTREMGVLMALGLKGRQVMTLFLLEGLLIGVVGAAVGCLLGGILMAILAQVGIDFSYASGMGEIVALMGDRLYPVISPADALSRGLAVAIIATLAALYPAWQAARKEPAEALHHI